ARPLGAPLLARPARSDRRLRPRRPAGGPVPASGRQLARASYAAARGGDLAALGARGRPIFARADPRPGGVRVGASSAGKRKPRRPRAAPDRLRTPLQPPDTAGTNRGRSRLGARGDAEVSVRTNPRPARSPCQRDTVGLAARAAAGTLRGPSAGLESRGLLRAARGIAGAIGVGTGAGELAGIDNQVLLGDPAAFEPVFEDLADAGGIASLGREARAGGVGR